MNSIELYINKQLCDIENPADFSVYLKRQLLSPGELSKKDAQKSYDITLPATATNNAIFGYTNIEEVKGKFNSLFDATLIVNGIKIFDGKFRLSEITNTSYKGNLGVPAKEIKDIFGDKMMNEMGEWLIDFEGDRLEAVNKYNQEKEKIKPCFFPYVLYGLLPKNAPYSDKDLWTGTIGSLENIPASLNCLETMKHLFKKAGFDISGNAFDDEALKNVYMSYHNDKDKTALWNIQKGHHIKVDGKWTNLGKLLSRGFSISKNKDKRNSIVTTLDRTNELSYFSNTNNSEYVIPQNYDGYNGNKGFYITVPTTAVYVLQIKATINFPRNPYDPNDEGDIDEDNDGEPLIPDENELINVVNKGDATRNLNIQSFDYAQFEIQLHRNLQKGKPAINQENIKFMNSFYKYNQDQEYPPNANYNQVFPVLDEVNRIDPKQSNTFIGGFSFGQPPSSHKQTIHPFYPSNRGQIGNPMAISGGKSLFKDEESRTYAATTTHKYINRADEISNEYDVQILNFPKNNAYSTPRGMGQELYMLVALNEGEELSLFSICDIPEISNKPKVKWMYHEIDFSLEMKPLAKHEWLINQLDEKGNAITPIDANYIDDSFIRNYLNLNNFLSSKIKTEAWVNDFTKAFNLSLSQIDNTKYELNIKRPEKTYANRIINLDEKTNVNSNRNNTSLGLPSKYEVKYKIKEDEEGYVKTKDSGSQSKTIDNLATKTFSQSVNFSYNWTKDIRESINAGASIFKIPIISSKEAWEKEGDYEEMQKKKYHDYTQRLWFKDNRPKLLDLTINNQELQAAFVTDTYDKDGQRLVLNYKDEPNSILNTYFTLLTDAENCYTTVECYLTPEEYSQIDSSMVKFNGDLYYVAEVDGYDPMCKRKATLKLVRKIQK